MKRQYTASGLVACALFTVACSEAPPPDTRAADAKAIRASEETWNKDFEGKNPAMLLAHYSDDATLMTPGMPAVHGKEAIGKSLKEMLADPALSLKFQSSRVEVAKAGDLAYSEGSFTITMTNPATKKPINDHGSYVTVYKKQADGAWKAVSDIATSEMPPAAPATKKASAKKGRKK